MSLMFPGPKAVAIFTILMTIFHACAIFLTIFRLYFRYYIRRLWWDDFFATLALCCNFVCMVITWVQIAPSSNPYTPSYGLALAPQSHNVHVAAYWLNMLFFTCSIWLSRLSIVSSVIRIVPPSNSIRVVTLGVVAVLVTMWLYMFVAKTAVCARDTSWYNSDPVQCPLPMWIAVSELTTDALSDFLLVFVPTRLLWRVSLPRKQRIMIRAVFSASILTSVASIVHTAFIIPPTIVGGMTAEVEAIVSLVVCNLLVVVTFIYRVTHGEGDSLTATEKTKDSSHPLTMVIELGSGDATSLGDTSTNTNTAYSSSGGIVSTAFTGSGLASSGGTSTGFSVSTPSGPAYSNFSVKETHTSKLSTNDGVLSIPEMDQSGSSTVVTQEHLGLPAQSS